MSTLRKFRNLLSLRREAWKPREVLLREQNAKLESMVAYAAERIPYYKDKYRSLRLDKHPVRTMKDLERLPLVTKQDIQERPGDFLAPGTDISRCLEMRTSGSTGRPLKIYYGERDDDFSKVNNLRSFLEIGYRYGDTFVFITDPEYAERLYFAPAMLAWQRRLNLFYPVEIDMRQPAGDMLEDLLRIGKCDVVYGYPTNLFVLAQEIERRGETRVRPRIVVTNGELLETPMREYINKIFGTQLFDFYTTEEFKRIAWECERRDGYHVDTGSVALEFLRDGAQAHAGQHGEIVITGLYNRTMPLIRYRQGDVGTESPSPCPCGRGLPLMQSLEGRKDDFVINARSERFSPQVFWSIFRHYGSIERYQIHQNTAGKIKVAYKSAPGARRIENDILEIGEKIRNSLGGDMDISFIPTQAFAGEKRKSVFSTMNLSF